MNYFRKTVISIICTIIFCAATAQDKRALVVGVGKYPAQSGWKKINGDNDIDIVCSFLADNGFTREGMGYCFQHWAITPKLNHNTEPLYKFWHCNWKIIAILARRNNRRSISALPD